MDVIFYIAVVNIDASFKMGPLSFNGGKRISKYFLNHIKYQINNTDYFLGLEMNIL